jgi:bisphosphoglycerate-dependent phosphoglycerate mutase
MRTDEPINTAPLQQFIQQVKAADQGQQKEVKIDITTAKSLTYSLATVLARLAGDYETIISKQSKGDETISIKADGGSL